MLLILNLPLIGLWVRLLNVPTPWLYAAILTFATLGVLGVNPSPIELSMLFVLGMLGFAMRLFDYPVAPVVVGLILGPLSEQQLRRALSVSQGDPGILVSTPLSAGLLMLSATILLWPLFAHAFRIRGPVISTGD